LRTAEKKIMADPELSGIQKELGDRVLAALGLVSMPVTSHEWKYVSSLQQWQLYIYTPWIKQKGKPTTQRALADAAEKAGITESTTFVRLRSPNLVRP
jgi:hypothetical protein